MGKAVCVISGGMDSALSAYMAKEAGNEIVALHFNYGQRTVRKELECFYKIVEDLGISTYYAIDLPFFEKIGASALIDRELEIPQNGIVPGVPVTYVPFRNGIFLSIAAAIAEKHKADSIYIGVVEEDSSGYPDCRAEYIGSMQRSIDLGTKNETKISIVTPLIDMSKADIVTKAVSMGVRLEHTWSCYSKEDCACGVCDSCRLRLRGFERAGMKDPIPYCAKG